MSAKLLVDTSLLEDLFSKYPSRNLPKNRPLLYQGEVPTMAFYIKTGVVRLYNITNQGEERTVGYEGSGGLLPLEWLFSKAPVSLYYYDTFTNCEIRRLPRDELIELLNQKPEAATAFLDRAISMYLGATMHLHALEQPKARQKILYILQFLTLRFGKDMGSSNQQIQLKLTHQEIANLIGITRETVSTEISKLTKETVIKVSDSIYTVNNDKATRLLGEEDFKELNL
jgi:CRP-like cAMP-binding protein